MYEAVNGVVWGNLISHDAEAGACRSDERGRHLGSAFVQFIVECVDIFDTWWGDCSQ